MLQADYDRATGLIVAYYDDTQVPAYQPTGVVLDDTTQVVRALVETIWPDPYLEQLPGLLGQPVEQWDEGRGVLRRAYPAAAYTPDRIRGALSEQLNAMTRVVLSSTDWAIVRKVDTGAPVPAHIARRRAAVRAWHETTELELAAAGPADLLVFTTSVPAELWDVPTAGGAG